MEQMLLGNLGVPNVEHTGITISFLQREVGVQKEEIFTAYFYRNTTVIAVLTES